MVRASHNGVANDIEGNTVMPRNYEYYNYSTEQEGLISAESLQKIIANLLKDDVEVTLFGEGGKYRAIKLTRRISPSSD